jgi:hypothetical protein
MTFIRHSRINKFPRVWALETRFWNLVRIVENWASQTPVVGWIFTCQESSKEHISAYRRFQKISAYSIVSLRCSCSFRYIITLKN